MLSYTSTWLRLFFFCGWASYVSAGVVITGLDVDGQLTVLEPSVGTDYSQQNQFAISTAARMLQINFAANNASLRPAPRLRYKLEGYDTKWHELDSFMRIYVRFFDPAGQIIGSQSLFIKGETPGWHGSVTNSDFTARHESFEAPPRATKMLVSILSGDPCIGILALDQMRVTVKEKTDGQSVYDLSVTNGTNLSHPLGTPINWVREGSRAELAQLRSRPLPSPHPVLVLHDDDPIHYGNWELVPESAVPVEPGDTVMIDWLTAHSMGAIGPGVAQYKRLPTGHYLFRVGSLKANGDPMEGEVELPILVVPPWYWRKEFWLLSIMMVATIAVWLGRIVTQRRLQLRLEKIEREQILDRERTRIAGDLHDRVGAGLAAIAMQSDQVSRACAPTVPPEVRRQLDFVNETAVDLVREVDEIVWAVNPANDTLDRLTNYVTHYTEQFLGSAGLSLRFDIPPALPAFTVEGTIRHSLMLVVMETLHNVVKHAGASLVRMKIRFADGWLQITITDNGCGMKPSTMAKDGDHDGLNNISRRLAAIGGRMDINSQPGEGTQVSFAVLLKAERKRE